MTRESLQHMVRKLDNARHAGGKRNASAINMIVLHCTGGDDALAAVGWLNRMLGDGESGASYHYLIPKYESQGIIRMCDPLRVAYHAGRSALPPARPLWGQSVNRRSIGISFANDNGGDNNADDDALTPWQRRAGLWLCVTLCERFKIDPAMIYSHREVAPGRKTDPLERICNIAEWNATVRRLLSVTVSS